jgi:hypothetical protein
MANVFVCVVDVAVFLLLLFCFSFLFVVLVGLVMQNIKEEGASDRAPARGRVANKVDDGTHGRFRRRLK